MRSILAIAIAGAFATWIANPALAAKKHNHSSETAVQKTDSTETPPYAPGQQRYKSDRSKKKSKTTS